MTSEDLEIIKEFLIESSENLARLDRDLVELEQRPGDAVLLASIFRTIHTIKGTCGFLNFRTLERITHHAESILSQVRNGERELTPELVSLTLQTVDAVKFELTSIESTQQESGKTYADLVSRQEQVANQVGKSAPQAQTEPAAPVVPEPPAEVSSPAPAALPKHSGIELTRGAVVNRSPVPTPIPEKPKAEPEPEPDAAALPQKTSETDATPKSVSVIDSTIRVDVVLLDKLMNLVGELVLARNQILQFNAGREDARLSATSQRLNLITRELQESVMKTRMQPIGTIWSKLPRIVRDLSSSCGKQIKLEMDGAETELDKTIIEAIKDPLTHIVRNSCDHGIEPTASRIKAGKPAHGTLTLRAFHVGGNVNIEIEDDGGGIDPLKVKQSAVTKGLMRPEQADRLTPHELVNLVFMPGFSTAQVVSNISGRGVGMDVVKTNIEKIGGAVELVTEAGKGTMVKIKIPLTLAIIPGMVITCSGERFVIPQVNLLDLVRLESDGNGEKIEQIHGAPVYRRRGNLLPLVYLNRVLKLPDSPPTDVTNIVVLQAEDKQFGLVVDGINDTQEIVVKPLAKQLKGVACYAGATIMGDGRVALILDVAGIARLSSILNQSRTPARAEKVALTENGETQMLLLFSAGDYKRLAVPLSLVARLEEIPQADIERSGNRLVLQYRGEIIPLVPLASQLGCPSETSLTDRPAQVIVFADGNRRIGFIVDRIIDVVEEAVSVKKAGTHPSFLGSAVVGTKVTDFLDVYGVIKTFQADWFQNSSTTSSGSTVLIADDSAFARGVLRTNLEMAGHRVIEANTVREAFDKLAKDKVDIVAVSLDLPGKTAFEFLESIKAQTSLQNIPILALSKDLGEPGPELSGMAFADCVFKYDHEGMADSLHRLSGVLGSSLKVLELAEMER